MATRTQVTLICDVCGDDKNVQTRAFGLDGKVYEADLCPKDSKGLSNLAAGYVTKARKVSARRSLRHNGRRPRSRAETAGAGEGGRSPRMKTSGRTRVPGSARQEVKTRRSEQQAAKVSAAKAKAAGSNDEAKAGRSRPQKAKATSNRTARAARAGKEKGIYVYGVLPADIEVAAEPGIGEHPGRLRAVRSDGLAALISEVNLSGRRLGSPADLRIHREILDATAAEVPVFPMRFGTVMASEDAVAEEVLAAHHDEFADVLEQLEGRAEFVVQGYYVEEAVLGEALLEDKQSVTAKREQDTRTLEHVMEGICVASVVRQPSHELGAVDAAFLVAVDQEGEMERVIEDLARVWEGRIDVQLLGPMAAYDFTGAAKPEGLTRTRCPRS